MIDYYLGEAVLLDNVPTYPCVDPSAAPRCSTGSTSWSSSRSTATAGRAS